jgi:hypothetical protein
MNQYLTGATKMELSKIDSLIEQNSAIIKAAQSSNENLLQDRKNLRYLCNHTDLEGKSTWEYNGQDLGLGKSEHSCTICGSNK